MKYNQLFNFTQFKQLYNTAKNVEENSIKRKLDYKRNTIINKTNLFSYNYKGRDYSINFNKNPGINSEVFKFINIFKAGEGDYNLIGL